MKNDRTEIGAAFLRFNSGAIGKGFEADSEERKRVHDLSGSLM